MKFPTNFLAILGLCSLFWVNVRNVHQFGGFDSKNGE